MNAEAANDVDPKYQLNPCSVVSVQVCVVFILIFVWV